MTRTFAARAALAVLAALAALAPSGCSKKGGSTQPGSGGPAPETFNSGVFSSSSPLKVFVHTFTVSGTHGYRCIVHGVSMSGSVQVGASGADSVTVNIGDNFFTPSPAQVKPGGYVKWVATGGNHGVVNN